MKKSLLILFFSALLFCGCGAPRQDGKLPRGKVSAAWTAASEAFCEATGALEAPLRAVPLSMMAVDHGKVVFEYYNESFAPDSLLEMFSIAKTVLALGVGCAVDEGLLSTEDKVVDYFPDKLPRDCSDTLSAMTVGNLLTMTCGVEESPKLLSAFSGRADFDWIEEFFNSPRTSFPGESFYYNFFAPYLVAAIVEKVTGTAVVDYIKPRLLDPMEITDLSWKNSPEGICIGGWGIALSTEDLAKFGQLLLQRGEWKGRRLVSSEWIDKMTSRLVPSLALSAYTPNRDMAVIGNPADHHTRGYGYYVWMDDGGTYRAEGLDGRYFFVNPAKERVFVITTDTRMGEDYMELVWEHFGNLI